MLLRRTFAIRRFWTCQLYMLCKQQINILLTFEQTYRSLLLYIQQIFSQVCLSCHKTFYEFPHKKSKSECLFFHIARYNLQALARNVRLYRHVRKEVLHREERAIVLNTYLFMQHRKLQLHSNIERTCIRTKMSYI